MGTLPLTHDKNQVVVVVQETWIMILTSITYPKLGLIFCIPDFNGYKYKATEKSVGNVHTVPIYLHFTFRKNTNTTMCHFFYKFLKGVI